MNTQPAVGISACLTGSAVRFDGGHKRMGFVMDELADWVAFKPVCPEMAIGLPAPRPALRLVQTNEGAIEMRFSQTPHDDVTEKMAEFTASFLPAWTPSLALLSVLNRPAAVWSACGCMTKMVTAGVKREWVFSRSNC
jgi:uncharacterized protein YbbK (DUF523 family)